MKNEFKKKKLAIIPAYNEEKKIGDVIKGIVESDKEIDILVIDDGSKDGTVRASKTTGVRVIKLLSNMGYGVAVQTGYKYAFEEGYDYVIQLDADGQHDPKNIPDLFVPIISGEADFVVGSRFLEDAKPNEKYLNRYKGGIIRKLGIGIFAYLATKLIGTRITDPTSGYRAFNRRCLAFFIGDFFPIDYPDADIIVLVHRAGYRIKELPVIMYDREIGTSMHTGLKPIYYIFKMFLSMAMTLLRQKPFYR